MREVKFRAWDKKAKRMLEVVTMSHGHQDGQWGWFITGQYTTNEIHTYHEGQPCYLIKQYDLNIIDHELMQYTGFRDVQDKEIYRGHIVKHKFHDAIGEIKWDDRGGLFYCDWHTDMDLYSSLEKSFRWEIIGSMYKNPDLLKAKNDFTKCQ